MQQQAHKKAIYNNLCKTNLHNTSKKLTKKLEARKRAKLIKQVANTMKIIVDSASKARLLTLKLHEGANFRNNIFYLLCTDETLISNFITAINKEKIEKEFHESLLKDCKSRYIAAKDLKEGLDRNGLANNEEYHEKYQRIVRECELLHDKPDIIEYRDDDRQKFLATCLLIERLHVQSPRCKVLQDTLKSAIYNLTDDQKNAVEKCKPLMAFINKKYRRLKLFTRNPCDHLGVYESLREIICDYINHSPDTKVDRYANDIMQGIQYLATCAVDSPSLRKTGPSFIPQGQIPKDFWQDLISNKQDKSKEISR